MDNNREELKNKWNKFWNQLPSRDISQNILSWYSLVWQVGLEYWAEIFEKYSSGKKILECGAGSAKVSKYMAMRGYDCTMLDNSWEGLCLGIKNFNSSKILGHFVLGDVTKLSFQDNTFDIVTSGGLLHHFEDIKPPIKEMVRVLKKDGIFAAVVIPKRFNCQTVGNSLYFIVKFLKDVCRGKWRGAISRNRLIFPFYINSLSLEEYKAVCQKEGLSIIIATALSPFPSLPLPKILDKYYAMFMKMCLPLWRKFDEKDSKFSRWWGATFAICGIKK